MPRFRRAILLACASGFTVAALGGAAAPRAQVDENPPQVDENPCISEAAATLNCPDLVMKRPFRLRTERAGRRTLLRAGNSIDSVGRGPAELHGVRTSARFMRARQRIYLLGGGYIGVSTGARLQFKFGHLNKYYWKFHNAARFELWRLDRRGRRSRRVRTGPKVSYCLRDLKRTRPRTRRSPRRRVYPACSTNPRRQQVTLGTSVGWSDIYGPLYPEQWIDVTGLRGCFAYAHIADPLNGIYESSEDNNEAQVIVRLPWRGSGKRGCPGRSQGPTTDGETTY